MPYQGRYSVKPIPQIKFQDNYEALLTFLASMPRLSKSPQAINFDTIKNILKLNPHIAAEEIVAHPQRATELLNSHPAEDVMVAAFVSLPNQFHRSAFTMACLSGFAHMAFSDEEEAMLIDLTYYAPHILEVSALNIIEAARVMVTRTILPLETSGPAPELQF